jgi:4-hydroxybenzoyl-CoA thioesterase
VQSTAAIAASYAPAVATHDHDVPRAGRYRHLVQVSWGDCDPAGIMYFPRFFEKFHDTMEHWFHDALHHPYDALIMGRRLGLPAVHTEADFRVPCRFGERLVVELRVPKLGRSSIELAYRVFAEVGEDEPRLAGRTVCALMDLDPTRPTHARAVPWPEDLRASIEAFGIAGDDHEGPA